MCSAIEEFHVRLIWLNEILLVGQRQLFLADVPFCEIMSSFMIIDGDYAIFTRLPN